MVQPATGASRTAGVASEGLPESLAVVDVGVGIEDVVSVGDVNLEAEGETTIRAAGACVGGDSDDDPRSF